MDKIFKSEFVRGKIIFIAWVIVTAIDSMLLSIECSGGIGCTALLIPFGIGVSLPGVFFGYLLPSRMQRWRRYLFGLVLFVLSSIAVGVVLLLLGRSDGIQSIFGLLFFLPLFAVTALSNIIFPPLANFINGRFDFGASDLTDPLFILFAITSVLFLFALTFFVGTIIQNLVQRFR